MVVFGCLIDNDVLVYDFIKETTDRLKNVNAVSNPFIENKISYKVIDDNKLLFISYLKPFYPKFYYFGFVWLLIAVLFNKTFFSWWYVPALIIIFVGYIIFHSKFFFYVFKKGLLKKGFTGKIVYLNHENIIMRWL